MAKRMTKFFEKNAWLIIILTFALIFGGMALASALLDSETQTNAGTLNGLEITYPKFEVVKINQPFNLTIHAYNISNGIEIVSANCTLMIYNQTGQRVLNEVLTSTGAGFNINLASGNFSQAGIFTFNIYCSRQPENLGGVADGLFKVNATGEELTPAKSIIYAVLFSILFFLFFANLLVISKFPIGNQKDESGIVTVTNMKYLTMVLVYIEWLFVFAMIYISYNLAQAFLFETLFSNYLFMIFRVMFGFTIIFTLLWFFWIIWNIIQDKQIKQMFTRGLPGSGRPGMSKY